MCVRYGDPMQASAANLQIPASSHHPTSQLLTTYTFQSSTITKQQTPSISPFLYFQHALTCAKWEACCISPPSPSSPSQAKQSPGAVWVTAPSATWPSTSLPKTLLNLFKTFSSPRKNSTSAMRLSGRIRFGSVSLSLKGGISSVSNAENAFPACLITAA